jgi:ATP-dependent metalloprotease
MIPEKDQLSMNKKMILASIDVAMGGRAAEELIFGYDQVTTGCGSDLRKATELAYMYVRSMGMKDETSLISSEKKSTSEKHNYLVDVEVQKLLKVGIHASDLSL